MRLAKILVLALGIACMNMLCVTLVQAQSTAGSSQQISAIKSSDKNIEYKYERWWSDADEAALERGDYSSILSRFDFIHTAFPRNGEAQENHFNNFYLGNGQIGMIVDPFGAHGRADQ